MNNFEITDYKFTPFKMEIDYVLGEYYYNVVCDFDWLEDEYNGSYLDFSIKPLHGSFFHETEDETGTIEITDEYTDFLQEAVKEFRNNTLWLYTEALERQQYLDRNEFDWTYYGI
jgi:hypothetical protein